MSAKPIGVFDSGIGGLTVVRALIQRLPHENIVYFGDTARVPYGPKSPQVVRDYAAQDVDVPTERDVKMVWWPATPCPPLRLTSSRSVRAFPSWA